MLHSLVWLSLFSLLSGLPSGWAWGKYMHYAKVLDANRAALWDVVIIVLSTVLTLTLWHVSGDNPVTLLAYALGSGLGTRVVVQSHRREHDRKMWNVRHYMT